MSFGVQSRLVPFLIGVGKFRILRGGGGGGGGGPRFRILGGGKFPAGT